MTRALVPLRQCKYPWATTHAKNALLPQDEFSVVQLQYPIPALYTTNNCIRCLHIAGQKFIARGCKHIEDIDPELLRYQHLPIEVIKSAVEYLESVPVLAKVAPVYDTEEIRTNRDAYHQIVAAFPKRVRQRRIQGRPGKANPQVAENNKRLQEAIRNGLWVQLFTSQQRRCACCKQLFTHHPQLDHDHRTLKTRALLCNDCNAAIGFAHESVERLHQLIDYLETH